MFVIGGLTLGTKGTTVDKSLNLMGHGWPKEVMVQIQSGFGGGLKVTTTSRSIHLLLCLVKVCYIGILYLSIGH